MFLVARVEPHFSTPPTHNTQPTDRPTDRPLFNFRRRGSKMRSVVVVRSDALNLPPIPLLMHLGGRSTYSAKRSLAAATARYVSPSGGIGDSVLG
jgi:hypothetical protein